MVLDATSGRVAHAWGSAPGMVGIKNGTWGAHGIAVETCDQRCSPDPVLPFLRVYIDDFFSYTLKAFGASQGEWLFTAGESGVIGNGTGENLQFGNLADSVISSGQFG